jgi:hypothetical protein
MKKAAVTLLVILFAIILSSCNDDSTAEISLALRNSTEFELQRVELSLQEGRPNYWVTVPLVNSDDPLKPGEERSVEFSVPQKSMKSREWYADADALGDEDVFDYDAHISLDGVYGFEITLRENG